MDGIKSLSFLLLIVERIIASGAINSHLYLYVYVLKGSQSPAKPELARPSLQVWQGFETSL